MCGKEGVCEVARGRPMGADWCMRTNGNATGKHQTESDKFEGQTESIKHQERLVLPLFFFTASLPKADEFRRGGYTSAPFKAPEV